MVTWKTCEKCRGSGKIDDIDCLECEGTGFILEVQPKKNPSGKESRAAVNKVGLQNARGRNKKA